MNAYTFLSLMFYQKTLVFGVPPHPPLFLDPCFESKGCLNIVLLVCSAVRICEFILNCLRTSMYVCKLFIYL